MLRLTAGFYLYYFHSYYTFLFNRNEVKVRHRVFFFIEMNDKFVRGRKTCQDHGLRKTKKTKGSSSLHNNQTPARTTQVLNGTLLTRSRIDLQSRCCLIL